MFRKMIRLAVEAVKVEIEHWRNPVQPQMPGVEVAPIPEKPAADPSTKKWQSSAFHMQALDSPSCPDCGKPKKLKAYRCGPCHEAAVAVLKARGVLRAT